LIQDLGSVLLQCGNEIWDNNVKLYLNNWIKGSPWNRTKVGVTYWITWPFASQFPRDKVFTPGRA